MTSRLPDAYFDTMYGASADPWDLRTRWYERRKYAITLSMLPRRRYRHAFEPGCSIGTLTERLTERCEVVTATETWRWLRCGAPTCGCVTQACVTASC